LPQLCAAHHFLFLRLARTRTAAPHPGRRLTFGDLETLLQVHVEETLLPDVVANAAFARECVIEGLERFSGF